MSTSPHDLTHWIRARRTVKVLGEVDSHRAVPKELAARNRSWVLAAIETAGWAPFHHPRQEGGLAEPWRVHVLWDEAAWKLACHLREERGVRTKEPQLAAACQALLLVTWLPEFGEPEQKRASPLSEEGQRTRDEEHLAATAAMVQNLLLLLTEQGIGNYWSSGGVLREKEVLAHLGVGPEERLLAALFLEYPEMREEGFQRKPGALRDRRGRGWVREVGDSSFDF
ncbi:MAG: nitroreductase family protein [Verrucomicrobiota bacterium]